DPREVGRRLARINLRTDELIARCRRAIACRALAPRQRGEGAMVMPHDGAGEGDAPRAEFAMLPLTPTLSPLRCASRGEAAHRVRGANLNLKEYTTCW